LPKQKEIVFHGHSIECRINAEDADRGFMPSPGRITALNLPGGPGVRVDTHVYQGYMIPPYYDSLIAKLIVHGADRAEAIARMLRALDECVFEGIKTTVPFHKRVLRTDEFVSGDLHTKWIEEYMEAAAQKQAAA
jgi:acetyl-CoA carboxylase biotin carboxylase subunit